MTIRQDRPSSPSRSGPAAAPSRFAVALLQQVLNTAESTYYAWKKQAEQPSDRQSLSGKSMPSRLK